MGINNYVKEIIEADATTYIIPEEYRPDILVSETLKEALRKEPQVNIIANLMPQCKPGTILIPEAINIDVCLAGSRMNSPASSHHLQTIFKLDAASATCIKNNPDKIPLLNEGVVITIEEPSLSEYSQIMLNTDIRVYQNHYLKFNECGLTIPHRLMDMPHVTCFPVSFLFKYQLESLPGFRVTKL